VIGDREGDVTQAFVSLASSLVNGYDPVDLLSELTEDCARLLDVTSAGLLLADGLGVLHVLAASSERTRLLELFQLQRDEGPCRDCFHTGASVTVADLEQAADRWPQFVPAARAAGFASVHALPLRLRDKVLGALGLFSATAGTLNSDDLVLGQALADVACIALMQDRAMADMTMVHEQLQAALLSRIVVEQAKGVLAQLGSLEMDEAFALLRGYARDHDLRLTDLAEAVVARTFAAQNLLDYGRTQNARRA
jgi:transcriptional regulator with GAF, ATPase, and Fis domain